MKSIETESDFLDKINAILADIANPDIDINKKVSSISAVIPILFSVATEHTQAITALEEAVSQLSRVISVFSMLVEIMTEKNLINETDVKLADLYYKKSILTTTKSNVAAKISSVLDDETLLKTLSTSMSTVEEELNKVNQEIDLIKNNKFRITN